MRKLLILLLMLWASSSWSQSLELSGAFTQNSFFQRGLLPDPFSPIFSPGFGYAFRVNLDTRLPIQVNGSELLVKAYVGYNRYDISSKISYVRVIGAVSEISFDIHKSTFDIGFFPINVHVFNRIQISLGGELNLLLTEAWEETTPPWVSFRCPGRIGCGQFNQLSSNSFTFRISSQFSYMIKLSETLSLIPQYQFSVGLNKEFSGASMNTQSMRHAIWIGVRKRLR